MVRLHVLWSATVTLHTPFFATVRFTPHCHTLFTRYCRLGTDILHTIGLLVCFTHLHRFPRFNLCDPMQSLAMQSLVASCHSLKPIQMTYSHGRQRNRLLRTNYSIFANSGTQPWMTAVPLLCTYYSIQCKTLAVSRGRQRNRLLCTNISIQCITLAVSLG